MIHDGPDGGGVLPPDVPEPDPAAGAAWHAAAERLADWASQTALVRGDRYGAYYRKGQATYPTTKPPGGPVIDCFGWDVLLRHFRATDTEHVVGEHLLAPPDDGMPSLGRCAALDYDNKQKRPEVAAANLRHAVATYHRLARLGFRPLLLTWGQGSIHLRVFFHYLQTGKDLRAFALWLASDAAAFGAAEPEAFPKQDGIEPDGFGNWLRLPGRHHTRDTWAMVFDGTQWVQGAAAVELVVRCTGDALALIPPEARPKAATTAERPQPRSEARGDSQDVFDVYNRSVDLDFVVRMHETFGGHTVTRRTADRAEFRRSGKSKGGNSFNVTTIDGIPFTKNFSSNSGLPDGKGKTPAQIRCFYQCGRCDTAAMRDFAPLLRKELGLEEPRVSVTVNGRPINDPHRAAADPSDRRNSPSAGSGGTDPTGNAPHDDAAREPQPRFRFITSADLAGGDYRPTWLVPGVLVKNQPGVIAGPSKAMKTSLLIDLAVSLAAGRPFLGEFEVKAPARVAVVSGESGAHTIQETARRVCKARGVGLAALDRLRWCFDLPTLANVGEMAEFTDLLTGLGAEVVVIDPLYLALGGDIDHANLFEMGARLRVAADTLLKAGITPVLVHHANRQLKTGEPMELTHLAYSGLEQFARQFLLVNRREPYRSDGVHDLWLRVGGSAGHGGLWGVHIEEGLTDEHFGGREWNVTVQDTAGVNAGRADEREAARREAGRAKVRREGTELLNAIDAVVASGLPAATMTRIRATTGFSANKIRDIARGLIEDGYVEEHGFEVPGGKGSAQTAVGYRRPPR